LKTADQIGEVLVTIRKEEIRRQFYVRELILYSGQLAVDTGPEQYPLLHAELVLLQP